MYSKPRDALLQISKNFSQQKIFSTLLLTLLPVFPLLRWFPHMFHLCLVSLMCVLIVIFSCVNIGSGLQFSFWWNLVCYFVTAFTCALFASISVYFCSALHINSHYSAPGISLHLGPSLQHFMTEASNYGSSREKPNTLAAEEPSAWLPVDCILSSSFPFLALVIHPLNLFSVGCLKSIL